MHRPESNLHRLLRIYADDLSGAAVVVIVIVLGAMIGASI